MMNKDDELVLGEGVAKEKPEGSVAPTDSTPKDLNLEQNTEDDSDTDATAVASSDNDKTQSSNDQLMSILLSMKQ